MLVKAIKTKKINADDSIYEILDKYLPISLEENSVVAITSKIVAICDGRIKKIYSEKEKDELVRKEAEKYLERNTSQYGFMLTINEGIMVASAGIDESNGNGYIVLWPEDPQKSANEIRKYLIKIYGINNVGVIITDSKLTPLRWGVTGVAISHSGFLALKDYIGTPDIFGREMRAEKSNIMDSLATAAVIEMGEGSEQKPLAVINDVNFVEFQNRNPNEQELKDLKIEIGDDVFSPMLTKVKWKKGGS